STLLWAYYAEGHKGIAVRFRISPRQLLNLLMSVDPESKGDSSLRAVKYSSDFPSLRFWDEADDGLGVALTTKSLEWRHEKEWRLVHLTKNEERQIPAAVIDGVILGAKVESETLTKLEDWAKKRKEPLKLWKAQFKPSSFELEVISLD